MGPRHNPRLWVCFSWPLFNSQDFSVLAVLADACALLNVINFIRTPFTDDSVITESVGASCRRLHDSRRSLAGRRVSAGTRRRDDVLRRLCRVGRLRRRRLRRRRQLVLVPRGAGDVRPCPGGTVRAADTPQTRLLRCPRTGVTSRAHLPHVRD